MAISNLYPAEAPTLNLNFANSRTLDRRITFTRTTGGTYMGRDGLIKTAAADEPRFDHRYQNGQVESLGLLIEEGSTNLVNYSTYFSSASSPRWVNVFPATATITTGIDAPDGTNTAVRLSCNNTGSSLLRVEFDAFTPNGTDTYTASFYVRKISGTTALNNQLTCDLHDGSPTTNYLPQLVTNQWVRIVVSGVPSNSLKSFFDVLSDRTTDYVLDFWGLQIERKSFATSYIPTSGSQGIRGADNASITGTNFSDWYNPSEGTVYADTRMVGVQTGRYDRLWAITNSNLNLEGISVFVAGPAGTPSGYVSSITITNSATEQVGGALVETALTTPRLKSAFAFKQNNCASSYNGQERFVDNIVDLSTFTTPPDRLLIGQPQRFQGYSCMTVSQLTYYPTRLTNAQLQNLTK